jgi:phosphoglucomutase
MTPLQAEVLLFLRRHAEAKVTDRCARDASAEDHPVETLTRPGAGRRIGRRKIVAKLTAAPGNGASIGGLKVVTEQGWFAPPAPRMCTNSTPKVFMEKIISSGFRRKTKL